MSTIAAARGVGHRYRRRTALRDIDAELRPGVLGLLGPNGAGKTTLLSILATVLRPTSGTVEIAGRVISSLAQARAARRIIGLLPQDFPFVTSYSALDMVRYSAWVRGVDRRMERHEAERCLRTVGLEAVAGMRMRALSGGMRQRVGLACALVGRPRILILDEPTVGLDPAQRLQFRDVLRSLDDVAVVLSTHLVEDVAAVADDVMVMNEGRALFRGSPEQLRHRAIDGVAGDTPLERAYMSVIAQDRVRA